MSFNKYNLTLVDNIDNDKLVSSAKKFIEELKLDYDVYDLILTIKVKYDNLECNARVNILRDISNKVSNN